MAELVKRRRWSARRIVVVTLLVLAALTAGAVALGMMLMRGPPSWWRSVDVQSPQTLAKAKLIEDNLTTVLSAVRQGASAEERARPWSMSLAPDDANAWLNARLPQWLAQQGSLKDWPPEVRQVQAHFDGSRIVIGAHIARGGPKGEFFAAALIAPEVHADGSLWLPASSLQVGRLPIPTRLVIGSGGEPNGVLDTQDRIPAQLQSMPQMKEILQVLAGSRAALKNPLLRLPDGRHVRLLGLDTKDGKLIITVRTEDPPPKR